MNIVCPNCSTVWGLDETKIPPDGKKVKCGKCKHIFKAVPEEEVGLLDPEQDLAAELSEDVEQFEKSVTENVEPVTHKEGRLILRQDSMRYSVADLSTLQRWIVERRVSRDAELSEDEEVWERVGDRMDLLQFFSIVERRKKKRAVDRASPGHDEEIEPSTRANTSEIEDDDPASAESLTDAVAEPEEASPEAVAFDPEDVRGHEDKLDLERALEAARHRDSQAVDISGASAVDDDKKKGRASASAGADTVGEEAAARARIRAPASSPSLTPPIVDDPRPKRALGMAVMVVIVLGGGMALYTRYLTPRQDGTNAVNRSAETHRGQIAQRASPGMAGVAQKAQQETNASDRATHSGEGQVAGEPDGKADRLPEGGTSATGDGAAAGDDTKTASEKSTTSGTAATNGSSAAPRSGTVASTASKKPAEPPGPDAVVSKPAHQRTTTSTSTGGSSSRGSSSAAYIRRGRSYLHAGSYDRAVESFRAAVDASPTSSLALKELGLGLMHLADVDYLKQRDYQREAIASLRKAVTINSRYAEAYHLLGVLYMKLGKKQEAADSLDKALKSGLKGDERSEAIVFLEKLRAELMEEAEPSILTPKPGAESANPEAPADGASTSSDTSSGAASGVGSQ